MIKEFTIPQKVKRKFIRDIYVNREFSWLLFNKRVLDQSVDLTNPLLERCKFLSIFTSNLDEFFMVRVGSLVNESLTEPDETENKTQLTAAKQLDGIAEVTRRLYEARSVCYNALRKELSAGGVKILRAPPDGGVPRDLHAARPAPAVPHGARRQASADAVRKQARLCDMSA